MRYAWKPGHQRKDLLTVDGQEESPHKASLQLRILRLGFLQDRNVGVGVFPEG